MDFNPVYIDDLTGVLNRRYLYERLKDEADTAVRSGHSLWFAMVDIDKFKSINDTYGHLQGDHILREVASIFRREVRVNDKVIRFGGDEFILLLIDGGLVSALNIINRIKEHLSACKFSTGISGLTITITISVGLAGYPDDTTDHEKLISLADEALYVAKSKGKSCIALVSDIAPDTIVNREILERFPTKNVVGREEEKETIFRFFSNKKEDILLVSGPFGIGKSKLLEEVNRIAFMQGFIPFYFRGGLYKGSLLYELWRYFEEHFLDVYPDIYTLLTEEELEILGSFKNVYMNPDLTDKILPVLKSVFQKINDHHSIVFVLDTMEQIDDESFWFIVQMISSKKGDVKVVCAYDSNNGEIAIKEFLDIFYDRAIVQEIVLEPVDEEWILSYLEKLFGDNVAIKDADLHSLYIISKGNVLYLEELLKLLMIKKRVIKDNTEWVFDGIPKKYISYTFRDIVVERVKSIDEDLIHELFSLKGKGLPLDSIWQSDIGIVKKGYLLDIVKSWQKVLDMDGSFKSMEELSINSMLNDILDILTEYHSADVIKDNKLIDINLLKQFIDIVSFKLYTKKKTKLSMEMMHLIEMFSNKVQSFILDYSNTTNYDELRNILEKHAEEILKILEILTNPLGFLYIKAKTDNKVEINSSDFNNKSIQLLIEAMLKAKIESFYIEPPIILSDVEAFLILLITSLDSPHQFSFHSNSILLNQVRLPVLRSYLADIEGFLSEKDRFELNYELKEKILKCTLFLLRLLEDEEYESREHILSSITQLYKNSPELMQYILLSFARFRSLINEGGVKVFLNFMKPEYLGKTVNNLYNQGLISSGFVINLIDRLDSQEKKDMFLKHVNELIFSQNVLRENVLRHIENDEEIEKISNSIAVLPCIDKWELIMNEDDGESVFSACLKFNRQALLTSFIDYLGMSLNNHYIVLTNSEYLKHLADMLIHVADKKLFQKFISYFMTSVNINKENMSQQVFIEVSLNFLKSMFLAKATDAALVFLSEMAQHAADIYEEITLDVSSNFYSHYLLDEFFRVVIEHKPIDTVLKSIFLSGKGVIYRLIREVVYAENASSIGYFDSFLMRRIVAEHVPSQMRLEVISWLSQYLVAKRWYVVRNAVEMLSYLIHQNEVNILRPVLGHPDERVLSRLVFVLNKLGGQEAYQMLSEVYNNISDIVMKEKILNIVKRNKNKDLFKDFKPTLI